MGVFSGVSLTENDIKVLRAIEKAIGEPIPAIEHVSSANFGFVADSDHITDLRLGNKGVTSVIDDIMTLTHLQTLYMDLNQLEENCTILHDFAHLNTLVLITSPEFVEKLSEITLPFSAQDVAREVLRQLLENPEVEKYFSQGDIFNCRKSWQGHQIDKAIVKTVHMLSSRVSLPITLAILQHCGKFDAGRALSLPLSQILTLTDLLVYFDIFHEFHGFDDFLVRTDDDKEEFIGLLKSSIFPKLLEYYSIAVFMRHHRVSSDVCDRYVWQLRDTLDNMKDFYDIDPSISTQIPDFSSFPQKIDENVPFISQLTDGTVIACITIGSLWVSVKLGRDPLRHLPPDEAAVLKDFGFLFLFSTDPFWKIIPGFGVVTVEEGHVTELKIVSDIIDLNSVWPAALGKRILSTLPPSIGQLRHLKSLHIEGHPLTTLSDDLGQLINLESLTLEDGHLEKLPDSLRNLTALKKLSLADNRLSALPDVITSLVNLEELDMDSNYISSCPDSLSNLSKLQKLILGLNNLSSLPETIGKLPLLKTLYLTGNKLSSLPQTIGKLSLLKILQLRGNKLSSLPESLEELSQLRILDLTGNELSFLPSTISRLTNLEALRVNKNRLKYIDWVNFSKLIQLKEFELDDNLLTELPEDIGALTNLDSLSLGNNPLNELPATIGRLRHVSGLSPELQAFYEKQRRLYESKQD